MEVLTAADRAKFDLRVTKAKIDLFKLLRSKNTAGLTLTPSEAVTIQSLSLDPDVKAWLRRHDR